MQDDGLNERVRERRSLIEANLREQVTSLSNIANEFDLHEVCRGLMAQSQRLEAERFEVMVCGRFKVGKSTFLNALLTSASRLHGIGGDHGPLPVDTLPCTAVLTRIEYAEKPFVRALYFDGRQEEWSFRRYLDAARIYGEGTEDERRAHEALLARISSFDLGLPVELLKRGLMLIDSPGIGEDPRRTAVANAALKNVHAGIVMLRNDQLGGTDEIEFGLQVIQETGHVFPVVNMYHGAAADERFMNALRQRTNQLRLDGGDKVETEVYPIDCRAAFEGYQRDDAALVRRSGIRRLESRLADFLLNGAYSAKVRATADGTGSLMRLIREELQRFKVALSADREQVVRAIDACDADIKEIDHRRLKVEAILDRTVREAQAEATDSYRHMCHELESSIEYRFKERPIASLSTIGGKLSSLVSKKAANEASEILHKLVVEAVRSWAETPPEGRGLQRDLTLTMEQGRRDLEEQFRGIDKSLQTIALRIGDLDLDRSAVEAPMSLADRMGGAGLGLIVFGPIGAALGATTGTRGWLGSVTGIVAAKATLALLAGAFGVTVGAPVAIAALITAGLAGMVGFPLVGLEDRVRRKALETVMPTIRSLAGNAKAIAELKEQVAAALSDEAAKVRVSLSELVTQQRESLAALRRASSDTLEAKEERLRRIAEAENTLNSTQRTLAELVRMTDEGRQEGEATRAA